MVNPSRRKNKACSDAGSEPEVVVSKKHKSRSKPAVAADTASTSSDLPDIHSKASQKKAEQADKVILDTTESEASLKSIPHKKKQAGSPQKSPAKFSLGK